MTWMISSLEIVDRIMEGEGASRYHSDSREAIHSVVVATLNVLEKKGFLAFSDQEAAG